MRRSREGGDSAKHLVPALGRLLMLLPGAHGSAVAKQLGVGVRVSLSGPGAGGQRSLAGARPDLNQMERVLVLLGPRRGPLGIRQRKQGEACLMAH